MSVIDKRGNRALIGITVMNIVLYGLTWLFYRSINRRRDKIWNSMTLEVCEKDYLRVSAQFEKKKIQEQQKYLDTTKDKGNQKLNFRFSY